MKDVAEIALRHSHLVQDGQAVIQQLGFMQGVAPLWECSSQSVNGFAVIRVLSA